MAAIVNKLRAVHLEPGDEVLVPAVCWSTSAFPLIQLELAPVFVDVDPTTLNADVATLAKHVTPRTKAVMAVHVLGNSCCMTEMLAFVALMRLSRQPRTASTASPPTRHAMPRVTRTDPVTMDLLTAQQQPTAMHTTARQRGS